VIGVRGAYTGVGTGFWPIAVVYGLAKVEGDDAVIRSLKDRQHFLGA